MALSKGSNPKKLHFKRNKKRGQDQTKNASASKTKLSPSAIAQPNASGGGRKKRPRYSDDFKRDAVALITRDGYTFRQAAQAVDVSEKSLRDWHAKIAPKPEPCGPEASAQELQAEIKSLRKQLTRAESERDILKKAAIYFANHPGNDTPSSGRTK